MTLELTPGAAEWVTLDCPMGWIELTTSAARPRGWGHQPAEDWADAVTGVRARWDVLPIDGVIRLRVAGDDEDLDVPEFEALEVYAQVSEDGRWLAAPDGRLVLSAGGDQRVELSLPPGELVVWLFSRPDCCGFDEPEALPDDVDPGLAEHLLVIDTHDPAAPRPAAELAPLEDGYRQWLALVRSVDPAELEAEVRGGEALALVAVQRLMALGEAAALARLRDGGGTAGELVALLADTRAPALDLDALPEP